MSTNTTDQADRWTQDEFEARIEELLNEARSTPVDRKHDARRASNGSSIALTDEERAERLAEALRGWWEAHRPVGWTEDQHRSCPHVNLATDAEKALATALMRDQEEGK